jgi:hypothetical protein
MSMRSLVLSLALMPLLALAQAPQRPPFPAPQAPLNTTTLAVLRANQPKGLSWDEWLRVTQAMLDTLDGREMDLRFRYMMVKE